MAVSKPTAILTGKNRTVKNTFMQIYELKNAFVNIFGANIIYRFKNFNFKFLKHQNLILSEKKPRMLIRR